MGRKLLKVLSLVEIIVAIGFYIALDYEYSSDPIILHMSELNGLDAKVYALFLYVAPAIHIIAGLLASIFNGSKKLMIFMSIIVLLSSLIYTNVLITKVSNVLLIINLVVGCLYFIGAILVKRS